MLFRGHMMWKVRYWYSCSWPYWIRCFDKNEPFDVHLHYFDRHKLPDSVEKELNLTFHEFVESMVKVCDVVTINCPFIRKQRTYLMMNIRNEKGAYIETLLEENSVIVTRLQKH